MKFFNMKYTLALLSALLSALLLASPLHANENFGYTLETNVVYGKGKITHSGNVVERDLLMDVYSPVGKSQNAAGPAVILVHGGAFHRGGLRQPPYKEAGAVHSGMEDYARLLASLGYTCFVIEYRLVPEQPVPDLAPDAQGLQDYRKTISKEAIIRTNFARAAMGMPAIGLDDGLLLWNGLLAAAEDLNKAVLMVQEKAVDFGIDPKRLAVGGHSAGATTVLNATYGLKSPVVAAFPLSPAVGGFDFQSVISSPALPPMLLIVAQNDEPAVALGVPYLIDAVKKSGLSYEFAWVPGFAHFYPTGAVSLGDNGTRMSVGERIVKFLDKHLGR